MANIMPINQPAVATGPSGFIFTGPSARTKRQQLVK